MDSEARTRPTYRDKSRIIDRLPHSDEYRRVKHLVLQQTDEPYATDDELARILPFCPELESVVLCGVKDTTDRTIVGLASTAPNLKGVDLSGLTQVTDVAVLELTAKSLPLEWLHLNGLVGLTDPSISAIAKSCPRLTELDVCDLPLLTAISVRDIWTFSRKLRTLRLARCTLLTDKAFPASVITSPVLDPSSPASWGPDKPLPPRPTTWLDDLSPLILTHTAESLRILDLTNCAKLTDEAVEGIVAHAPKIQTLVLSGCKMITDRAVRSICHLRDSLDVLVLAHAANITDRAIVKLARSCSNLRSLDVGFCRNLSDMAVFEIASLTSLRRLSLVRVQKLTDNAIHFLAEHAKSLESLHLSYCDHLSLEAVHLLLKKLEQLEHLTATGIPPFRRRGVKRFSDSPPSNYGRDQRAAFRVFNGENIAGLRKFLDKEEQRRQEAENKNMKFLPRADDKLDLY